MKQEYFVFSGILRDADDLEIFHVLESYILNKKQMKEKMEEIERDVSNWQKEERVVSNVFENDKQTVRTLVGLNGVLFGIVVLQKMGKLNEEELDALADEIPYIEPPGHPTEDEDETVQIAIDPQDYAPKK